MKIDISSLLNNDTVTIAKMLLGMELYLEGKLLGRIVETEAYLGVSDSACHSYGGRRTMKNESMYLKAGHWYVYQIHGHHMLNLVTAQKGVPEAVLIRALEVPGEVPIANGPGKLTRFAKITRIFDGQAVEDSKLSILEGVRPRQIKSRARIGIRCTDNWRDFPLCFYVHGNRHVSKIRKVGLLADHETWSNEKFDF